MFLDNKYTKWYNAIILHAREHPPIGYTESHHIVPKCMGGGNGNNRVNLSARQHFVCHWLLTKMVQKENYAKMQHALWHMMQDKRGNRPSYMPSSRVYALLRKSFSDSRKGIKFTEEHKQRLREAAKRRNPRSMVRIFTEEYRQKLSDAAKRRPSPAAGRKLTAEHKQKLREAKLRMYAARRLNTEKELLDEQQH